MNFPLYKKLPPLLGLFLFPPFSHRNHLGKGFRVSRFQNHQNQPWRSISKSGAGLPINSAWDWKWDQCTNGSVFLSQALKGWFHTIMCLVYGLITNSIDFKLNIFLDKYSKCINDLNKLQHQAVAPRYRYNYFLRLYQSQVVVWDFFHQQYHQGMHPGEWKRGGWTNPNKLSRNGHLSQREVKRKGKNTTYR